jgi:hypothetical protein
VGVLVVGRVFLLALGEVAVGPRLRMGVANFLALGERAFVPVALFVLVLLVHVASFGCSEKSSTLDPALRLEL